MRFDVVRAKRQGDVEKDLQRFYQAEVLVPSPILPHLIVFPKKPVTDLKVPKVDHESKAVTPERALGDGSGNASVGDGCLTSDPMRPSLPCSSLTDSGPRATKSEVDSCLIVVGRRLFPNFIAWLVSVMSFCYLELMLLFTITLIDCLRQGLCSITLRQRMQLRRSLQLWHSMDMPPPLPVNGHDKCEFAAVPCDAASITETPCCASRRCAEHSQRNYVCSCWITLTNVTRKRGPPERRMRPKDVKLSRCGAPLRKPNPKCADCREGLIICEHRGEWDHCLDCLPRLL